MVLKNFYKNLLSWCVYHNTNIKYFDCDLVLQIYKAFKLRYKTFLEFYKFYELVTNNTEYIILHPKVIEYNNKFQNRIATKYEKIYLQLAMQMSCLDYNTPTANEIINLYACKKKKSDPKV